MNVNQILNMVIRLVMRKVVNGGINAGINAVSNRKGKGTANTGQGPGSADTAKRAKQTIKMARRLR